jgi:outer membrane receptor protein involved in Fe transport
LGVLPAADAQAQDTNQVKKLEPVTITGSHIATLDIEPIAPVVTFDREYLDRSGATTLSDVLRKLPINSGGSYGDNNASSFTPGSAGVSLRGLGQQSTLVLVNGRRVAAYPFAQNINGVTSSFVDLNSIPIAAVERVEILKDSGSAIYGSDAMAGVVNVILRKDYTGAEVGGMYGNTTKSDSGEVEATFVGGLGGDKGSMMVFVDYYDRNAQMLRDSSNTDKANFTPQGGYNFKSSRSNLGRVTDPFTGQALYVPPNSTGILTTNDLSPSSTKGNWFNFNRWITDYPETTRYGGYTIFNYEVHEKIEAFLEAGYRNVFTRYESAPTPIDGDADGIFIGPDNPFNPYKGITNAPIAFRYRTTEVGPRIDEIDTDFVRALPGLRFHLPNQWEAETAFLYNSVESVDVGKGFLSLPALQSALNDTNPATAFNPLGGKNYKNPRSTLNDITVRTYRLGEYELMSYDLKAAGPIFDIPGGQISLAVGGETRWESILDEPDSLSAQFGVVSSGGVAPSEGDRDAQALFAEINVPIFSAANRKDLLEALELQVAGRYENYSDFGDTAKPKIGLKWQPVKPLMIRGSYSQGFRAPSLAELFVSNIGFQDGLIDTRRYAQTGSDEDNGTTQYKIETGGNPDLQPEESESFYAGFVVEPPMIKGLSFGADYSHITVKDVIQADDVQSLLNLPIAQQAPYIHRAPPTPEELANGVTIGKILSIDQRFVNLSERKVDAVDLSLSQVFDTSAGVFTLDGNATYLWHWQEKQSENTPTEEFAGTFALPRWRMRTSLFWTWKKFTFGPSVNYVSSYEDGFGERDVDDWITVDLQATYQAPFDTTITVGVLNVGGEPPPFTSYVTEGYDTQTHDNRGRYWYIRVTKKL